MDAATVEQYLTIGAGGVSFLVLVGIIWYLIKKQQPLLDNVRTENAAHAEVMRNVTDAVKEVSRSNDNVAEALKMINVTFKTFDKNMDKHNTETEVMKTEIFKISERTNLCLLRDKGDA